VREARFRHVNENKEIKKTTKRDAEGQKSNTGASQTEKAATWKSERRRKERKRK
jgi:hypothetical protein